MADLTTSILKNASLRSPLPRPRTRRRWQDMGNAALGSLLKEQASGYAGARHVMPFPREVFRVQEDFQTGDVFQRALILDTFLDFYSGPAGPLAGIIAAEADYLIGIRRRTGVGGWAYFPGLTELPPDADDLAQAMQVLLRAGYRQKATPLIEVPLKVLLADQANEDGGWESWIVPGRDQNEEQQLQTAWIHKAWGSGSDAEVVANLIFALTLYDPERFSAAIDRGMRFLVESHQGYRWESTWYYGDYYGTYVALRALCAANGPREVIDGSIRFLLSSRRPDGGWAVTGEPSSALQTALALLALSMASHHLGYRLEEGWLEASLEYLEEHRGADDNWPSSPFIRMPMGRPSGYVHTILTYESTAITNNYVAKVSRHLSHHHFHQD